jgi:hypothetical protein
MSLKFPITLEPIPIIGGNQDRLPNEQKTVPLGYGGGLGLSRGPASRGAARPHVSDGVRDADDLPDNSFHEPSLNWGEPDFTIDDSDFSNYSDPADADFSDFEDVDLGPSRDLRPPGRHTFRPTKRQKVSAAVGAGAAAAAVVSGAGAASAGLSHGDKAQGFEGKNGGGTGTPQQQIPQPPTARPQPAQQTPRQGASAPVAIPARDKPQPEHVLWDGVKFEYPSDWFDVPSQLNLVRESLASYSRVKTENADMRAR